MDEAAYNTADMTYYSFTHDYMMAGPYDTLISISSAGVITAFTKVAGDGAYYQNVLYDPLNNKLYCLKNRHLAELSLSGTNYSATEVLTDSLTEANTETINSNGRYLFYDKDRLSYSRGEEIPSGNSNFVSDRNHRRNTEFDRLTV